MNQLYELLHQVGQGGMGMVYAANKHPSAERLPVAVKVLRSDLPEMLDQVRALFHREAVTSWRINHDHPNLTTVYDFGETVGGIPYLVMEYVDGVSLDLLHRGPEPEYPVIRRIARDILAALAHLHDHDLMHRDVTPRNVLMSQEGTAKVTDLGLVKEQQGSISGCFCGTPAYASPEALQGRRYTPSSDLYSVATILYELLTNMKPNGAGRPDEVLESIYNDDRPPLAEDVPEDLAKLVDGLMAVDPMARTYRTAAEALDQLDGPLADDVQLAAIVAQSPRPEPDPNVPELGWPFSKHEPEPQPMPAPETPRIRSGWLTALVLSLALSLGTLGLGFGLGRTNSTTPATTPAIKTPSAERIPTTESTPTTLTDVASDTSRSTESATTKAATPKKKRPRDGFSYTRHYYPPR